MKAESKVSKEPIAPSILPPPNLANTYYFSNDKPPASADHWLSGATRIDGSWWSDPSDLLRKYSGPKEKCSDRFGSPAYPPLCKAPGHYILEPMSDA